MDERNTGFSFSGKYNSGTRCYYREYRKRTWSNGMTVAFQAISAGPIPAVRTIIIMKYPIVQVKTRDNLWLYGLYLCADKNETVFINIHGTASNFYEEYFIEVFANAFLEKNISVLSTNNRGAGVYDPYQKSGAAVEKFENCLTDIDAWIEFAISEKYKEIILSGHSL